MTLTSTRILACVLALSAPTAWATTFYVSNSGNDAADGGINAPWQTIAKVNAVANSLHAGDSVLFARGQTFSGGLVPTQSGTANAPITYGAWGSGAKPIISGYGTVTGWTSTGTNLWEGTWPGNLTTVSSLQMNGKFVPIGRYPKATATNGGYLTFEHHSGSTSITDDQLTGTPDFTGGEIVIRMVHWLLHRSPIATHSGGTLTFTAVANSAVYPLIDGYGYFIQNHPATLTVNGDWYYTLTGRKVGLYSTTTPSNVRVPVVDQLVTISSDDYLTFQNLAFEGSNGKAISINSANGITIDSCDFSYAGTTAIWVNYSSNTVIKNNTIANSLGQAISANNPQHDGFTVSGNTITNTGLIVGMNEEGSSSMGVRFNSRSGALIELNTIRDTGYTPIYFQGSNLTIRNNVIDGYASVLDDTGGIYTWNGPKTPYTARTISHNVISRGIGAALGTLSGVTQANGIYFDNNSSNLTATDNTVFNVANNGAHMNSPQNVVMSGNNFYDVARAYSLARWTADGTSPIDIANGGQDISGLDFHGNAFISRDPGQVAFSYNDQAVNFPMTSTIEARLSAMGTINANWYSFTATMPFSWVYKLARADPTAYTPLPVSFSQWKLKTGYDSTSVELPYVWPLVLNSTVGNNLVTNSEFTSNISGVTTWTAANNHTATWDGTSKISGAGSLKLDVSNPEYKGLVLIYGPVGAISSSKTYVIRVTTLGTTEFGQIQGTFRQSVSPYADLAPAQARAFGTAKQTHEFIIQAPTSEASASFHLKVLQTSGTTYLDSIQVYEATATAQNYDDFVLFLYNAGPLNVAKTIPGGTWVDLAQTAWTGGVRIAPFSSVVLRRVDGGTYDAGTVVDAGRPDAGPAGGGSAAGGGSVSDGGSSSGGGSASGGGTATGGGTAAGGGSVSGGGTVTGGGSAAGGGSASGGGSTSGGGSEGGGSTAGGTAVGGGAEGGGSTAGGAATGGGSGTGGSSTGGGGDMPSTPPCSCASLDSLTAWFAAFVLLRLRRRTG